MIKRGNTPAFQRTVLEDVDKLQQSWSLWVLFAPRGSQKPYLEAPLLSQVEQPEGALLQRKGQLQKVAWWERGRRRAVF